jgi:hypothetical protein
MTARRPRDGRPFGGRVTPKGTTSGRSHHHERDARVAVATPAARLAHDARQGHSGPPARPTTPVVPRRAGHHRGNR